MGEFVKLKTADGFEIGAYVARPAGEPIAALVVVQEIFGVNAHIRSVADGYAQDGFLAVAPAMFDRFEPGVELGYDAAGWKAAMAFVPKLNPAVSLHDVAAAHDVLRMKGFAAVQGRPVSSKAQSASNSFWPGDFPHRPVDGLPPPTP